MIIDGTTVAPAVAGGWWDPVTWWQSLSGFFSGAFNLASGVENALGAVLTILGSIFRFFTDTGHFIQDTVQWLANALFPPELQTWFLGTIGYPGHSWNPASIFEQVFHAVQAPALLVTAVAAAARILRAALDHRVAAGHAFLDVLPRFLVAVAFIGIPGTSVSPAYLFIVWSVNASMALAAALFGLFLHASLLPSIQPREGWFSHLDTAIASAGRDVVAVAIGGLPLLILLLYALFLMVTRTVMLGFCVATAPLCLATAAFDVNNRFLHWWLDLFLGVLLMPIVLGVGISLSATIASSVVDALAVGPILAFVVMCGGLWFSSRMVHHITWRHFSHGSALAGFAAGVSTMLGPVQKLGTAGFMAEALGANRRGDNSAINFIKRLGLATQHVGGLSEGAVARTSLANGAATSFRGGRGDVSAGGGPPDVTTTLAPSARQAVAGVEALFSQKAFNAFTRGHQRLIGSLTRDHPYGSMSMGDRAKVAWERVDPPKQSAFADEFLSTWLGTVDPEAEAPRLPDAQGSSPLVSAEA